jgi:hypothetical protein
MGETPYLQHSPQSAAAVETVAEKQLPLVALVVDLHTTALAAGDHVVPQELEPRAKAIMVGSVHITHMVQVAVVAVPEVRATTPLEITSVEMVE